MPIRITDTKDIIYTILYYYFSIIIHKVENNIDLNII